MKNVILRNCALLAVAMAVLSGCSAHCNCPVCPQTPTTNIIHEP